MADPHLDRPLGGDWSQRSDRGRPSRYSQPIPDHYSGTDHPQGPPSSYAARRDHDYHTRRYATHDSMSDIYHRRLDDDPPSHVQTSSKASAASYPPSEGGVTAEPSLPASSHQSEAEVALATSKKQLHVVAPGESTPLPPPTPPRAQMDYHAGGDRRSHMTLPNEATAPAEAPHRSVTSYPGAQGTGVEPSSEQRFGSSEWAQPRTLDSPSVSTWDRGHRAPESWRARGAGFGFTTAAYDANSVAVPNPRSWGTGNQPGERQPDKSVFAGAHHSSAPMHQPQDSGHSYNHRPTTQQEQRLPSSHPMRQAFNPTSQQVLPPSTDTQQQDTVLSRRDQPRQDSMSCHDHTRSQLPEARVSADRVDPALYAARGPPQSEHPAQLQTPVVATPTTISAPAGSDHSQRSVEQFTNATQLIQDFSRQSSKVQDRHDRLASSPQIPRDLSLPPRPAAGPVATRQSSPRSSLSTVGKTAKDGPERRAARDQSSDWDPKPTGQALTEDAVWDSPNIQAWVNDVNDTQQAAPAALLGSGTAVHAQPPVAADQSQVLKPEADVSEERYHSDAPSALKSSANAALPAESRAQPSVTHPPPRKSGRRLSFSEIDDDGFDRPPTPSDTTDSNAPSREGREHASSSEFWKEEAHPRDDPRFQSRRVMVVVPFPIRYDDFVKFLQEHFSKYGRLRCVSPLASSALGQSDKAAVVFKYEESVARLFSDDKRHEANFHSTTSSSAVTIRLGIFQRPAESEFIGIWVKVTGPRHDDRSRSASPTSSHRQRSEQWPEPDLRSAPPELEVWALPTQWRNGRTAWHIQLWDPRCGELPYEQEGAAGQPQRLTVITLGRRDLEREFLPKMVSYYCEIQETIPPIEPWQPWRFVICRSWRISHLLKQLRDIPGFTAGKWSARERLWSDLPPTTFPLEPHEGDGDVDEVGGGLQKLPYDDQLHAASPNVRRRIVHTHRGRVLRLDTFQGRQTFVDDAAIYVVNLPLDETEQSIRERFSRYGKVLAIETERRHRFMDARIMYENRRGAQSALMYEDGANVSGRTIKIKDRLVPPRYVEPREMLVDDSGRVVSAAVDQLGGQGSDHLQHTRASHRPLGGSVEGGSLGSQQHSSALVKAEIVDNGGEEDFINVNVRVPRLPRPSKRSAKEPLPTYILQFEHSETGGIQPRLYLCPSVVGPSAARVVDEPELKTTSEREATAAATAVKKGKADAKSPPIDPNDFLPRVLSTKMEDGQLKPIYDPDDIRLWKIKNGIPLDNDEPRESTGSQSRNDTATATPLPTASASGAAQDPSLHPGVTTDVSRSDDEHRLARDASIKPISREISEVAAAETKSSGAGEPTQQPHHQPSRDSQAAQDQLRYRATDQELGQGNPTSSFHQYQQQPQQIDGRDRLLSRTEPSESQLEDQRRRDYGYQLQPRRPTTYRSQEESHRSTPGDYGRHASGPPAYGQRGVFAEPGLSSRRHASPTHHELNYRSAPAFIPEEAHRTTRSSPIPEPRRASLPREAAAGVDCAAHGPPRIVEGDNAPRLRDHQAPHHQGSPRYGVAPYQQYHPDREMVRPQQHRPAHAPPQQLEAPQKYYAEPPSGHLPHHDADQQAQRRYGAPSDIHQFAPELPSQEYRSCPPQHEERGREAASNWNSQPVSVHQNVASFQPHVAHQSADPRELGSARYSVDTRHSVDARPPVETQRSVDTRHSVVSPYPVDTLHPVDTGRPFDTGRLVNTPHSASQAVGPTPVVHETHPPSAPAHLVSAINDAREIAIPVQATEAQSPVLTPRQPQPTLAAPQPAPQPPEERQQTPVQPASLKAESHHEQEEEEEYHGESVWDPPPREPSVYSAKDDDLSSTGGW